MFNPKEAIDNITNKISQKHKLAVVAKELVFEKELHLDENTTTAGFIINPHYKFEYRIRNEKGITIYSAKGKEKTFHQALTVYNDANKQIATIKEVKPSKRKTYQFEINFGKEVQQLIVEKDGVSSYQYSVEPAGLRLVEYGWNEFLLINRQNEYVARFSDSSYEYNDSKNELIVIMVVFARLTFLQKSQHLNSGGC